MRSVSFFGQRSEVAHFSREAATAHSRGRQPTESEREKQENREAVTALVHAGAGAASRLTKFVGCFLRADARS